MLQPVQLKYFQNSRYILLRYQINIAGWGKTKQKEVVQWPIKKMMPLLFVTDILVLQNIESSEVRKSLY